MATLPHSLDIVGLTRMLSVASQLTLDSGAASPSRHLSEASAFGDRSAGRALQQRHRAVATGDQFQGNDQRSVRSKAQVERSASLRPASGDGGAARQETALTQEGVEVGRGSLGERTVDFSTYGWFPPRLPSDDAEDGDSE